MNDLWIVLIGLAWKLPVAFVAMSLGERWIHKHVLHGRWLYDHVPAARYIYRNHAIDHHSRGQNDRLPHIDLTILDYWPALPFWIVAAVRCFGYADPGGLSSLIALPCVVLGHMTLWNKLHRAIHGLEPNNWATRLPFYQRFARHHRDHHLRPDRNFGVVCIWTDRAFGTEWRSNL